MGVSTKANFGVHSAAPYNRDTGKYYGIFKVLKSSSLSLGSEQIDLTGGSAKYPFASEDGKISAEMSLKVGELPNFAYELFLGKAVTEVTASATGTVSTAENVQGTSMLAATGLVQPTVTAVTGAAQLKFGKYLLVATAADDFDIFMSTDIDHGSGTSADYSTDLLKVGAVSGVATGVGSPVANLGLTFTGGAGATAFEVGDTMRFEVLPPHSGGIEVVIGSPSDLMPEFGCIIMGQKRGDRSLYEVDCFRCKGSGMPLPFESFAWTEPEIKAKLLYDADRAGVFKIRQTKRLT